MASFPNNVWNGESSHRNTPYINRKPDNVDWNRIVDELIATQAYIKYLETVISQGGGGGGGVSSVAGRGGNVTLSSTDISGLAPSATTDTTNASNISSGILNNNRLPNLAGGTSGQIQINNNGSLLGLNGNSVIIDPNGPTDAVAIGINSWALGEQSMVIGNHCIASTDYSSVTGYNCIAGDPRRACTISGLTVTIPGGNFTSWFYDQDPGALVLSQLSGGTDSTITYADIAEGGVAYDGTNTVLTLSSVATSHTAGFANMRDDCIGSHAEGFSTQATGFLTHAEGRNTVASGGYAHVEGVFGVASGTASHVEGQNGVASGAASHVEGQNGAASGTASHVEGLSCITFGMASHAEGNFTTASGISSHAGGKSSLANLTCQWARSDGSVPGQIGHLIASGQTIDTTPVILLISSTDRLSVTNNRIYAFVVDIVGYKTDGSKFACFLRRGLISNVGGVTTLIGSVLTIGIDNNIPNWSVDITADATNNALAITVTGETTVNWRARVDFTEVGI